MKHIKLFENFEGTIDPRLEKALKNICMLVKDDILGSIEHPSEYFGDGDVLLSIANTVSDNRIKDILIRAAECSESDYQGSIEHISEWIGDDDCDYIADFLGIPRLNLEDEWTDDENSVYYTELSDSEYNDLISQWNKNAKD